MLFDETWASNRFLFRKRLKGTRVVLDTKTGFLEPACSYGFNVDKKLAFIDRLKLCSNVSQICRSVEITPGTFYDAVAMDKGFREAVNVCNLIVGRAKQLNSALAEIKKEEDKSILQELTQRLNDYK